MQVDDRYLLDHARAGSVDAFEALVERYSPVAFRIAMRLVNDCQEATDITQDAFVTVWRTLSTFPTDASFSVWIYTVVTRRATIRHPPIRHDDPVDHTDALLDDTSGPAGATSRPRDVDAAVAALPLAQRVALVLHHYEGLSYVDVAAITATSIPLVRSHLFRARRTLLSTLGAMEVTT